SISCTLTANVENLTLLGTTDLTGTGNTLNNVLTGNSGANLLAGGLGNDTLKGGTGNDTYQFNRGDGVDTVIENDATVGNSDVALFGSGIAEDQLWFKRSGNNLEVSLIGTLDRMVYKDWYLGSQYHVEQFKTSNGQVLLESQVANLVSAMASFSAPPMGETTLSPTYAAALEPVLAANWQ
ncbi:MAG: hypothetical protein FD130_1249, partial [Halothiobacillaceae bacterium]